jgi:diguanylate cyclase (GGDEF)-like protein/PAS domain S-box-containing protein
VSIDVLECGVLLTDAAGVVQRVNVAAERILGFGLVELSRRWGDPGCDVYDEHGAVLGDDQRPLARAMAGEPVSGQVMGWRHSNGQRILLRVSSAREGVAADGWVVTLTDITAEHLARRLLEAAVEAAPVGLAIVDVDRVIVRCNTTFAVQAGRPVVDLVGVDIVELLHPGDKPDAVVVGQRIRTGARSSGDLDQRVLRPDGTEIYVNTRLAVIPDPDHPYTVAATFDVTERRRMVRELTRFSYLFEHANDIITVIDATGHVLYASPSNERILGYPPGYRLPGGVLGLIHPDDLGQATALIAELVDGGTGSQPFTVRVRSHGGEWRDVECVATNLLGEPEVAGIVITARDVTERVLLTGQLAHRSLHDTLTDLPNRRMLDITLTQALARSRRDNTSVGLCFIDLDGFKTVNDTLGHASGDRLLVAICDRIRTTIRASDVAARVGGDEFVVVLNPVTGAGEAVAVATRLRDTIIEMRYPLLGDLRIGASIGVTTNQPDDDPSSFLNRADEAMYRAKAHHNSSIDITTSQADTTHPIR